QFRAEDQPRAALLPIERLDAEPVAHEIEHALLPVPHRQSEHADEPRDRRLDAPLRDALDDHLGVALAAEAPARGFELRAERAEIIDLAIEGEDEAAAGREHGLRPRGR